MLDVIERQIDFVEMAVRAAELPPIVGQQRRDGQSALPVEGQDFVMQLLLLLLSTRSVRRET